MKIQSIKTKRFVLRLVKKGDEFDIARNINDKTISRNTAAIPYPYKLKDAKDWVKKCLSRTRKKELTDIVFSIVIKKEVVGAVGLHDISYGHKAEIGYWLAKKHWGKGLATEVAKEITKICFNKLKLKRVTAKVYLPNKASARVLEKNGFKLEGILRRDSEKNGKLHDVYLYAKVR
jgi:RimJ/RimL family protein N-acetyltransferase